MGCYTYCHIVRLALSVFVIWPVCVGRLTAGAMIPPPKRVDSVEVYNDIKEPVTFKVFYENVKEQVCDSTFAVSVDASETWSAHT